MKPTNDELLSKEECREIADLMQRKYASYLDQRYFDAKIAGDQFAVHATVTLRSHDGSYVYPVEGRLAYADQDLGKREASLLLFDYIDLYFEEYFKEGDVHLPIDWADYEYKDIDLQLKGQILNERLERQADAWLEGRGDTILN